MQCSLHVYYRCRCCLSGLHGLLLWCSSTRLPWVWAPMLCSSAGSTNGLVAHAEGGVQL